MDSQRKNELVLSQSDFELFALIKEGILGPCTHLMSKNETNEVLQKQSYKGEMTPYSFSFAPQNVDLSKAKAGDEFALVCEGERVGKFRLAEKFQHKGDIKSIFTPDSCFVDDCVYISGDFELENSPIAKVKQDFERLKAHLNAQKITAIIASLDPLHRAHERIFRWTIDKADLIVVFLIESYEKNGLEFELKKACLEKFIELYLPKDRIFVFPLRHIGVFSTHLNVILEATIAKNLGCTKLVVGQNHAGLGMFYEQNRPRTILDDISQRFGIEVVVLPEFVYCNKCKISVSTRSCPHGSHHHIKFHSNSLKDLLKMGIIPPTIFMRREISAMILKHFFPNRFEKVQNIYNDLFPNTGIVAAHKKDEDFYEQLLSMYQVAYMV